tara:strand:+ start:78 stop:296 length:219 start_codon:yes stop_codon:yes gene_type:complete
VWIIYTILSENFAFLSLQKKIEGEGERERERERKKKVWEFLNRSTQIQITFPSKRYVHNQSKKQISNINNTK